MRYLFEGFELNTEQGRLMGPAGPINLRPKAYALLLFLIERAPALTAQDDIIDAVWGHSALSRNVLPQTIRDLRIALGDSAQPSRFIETRHRRGYRWIAGTRIADATVAPPAESPAEWPTERQPTASVTAEPAKPASRKAVWFNTLLALLCVAAIGFGIRDRLRPSPVGPPALQWVWLGGKEASPSVGVILSMLDPVLRWETDLRSDDLDANLPLLSLTDKGDTLHWLLQSAPGQSTRSTGELHAANLWQDIDVLVSAVQSVSAREARGLDPLWPRSLTARAQWQEAVLAESDERLHDAHTAWRELLASDPDNPLLRLMRRQLLMRQGDWSALPERGPALTPRSPLGARALAFDRFLTLIEQGAPIGINDPLATWLRAVPQDSAAALWRLSEAATRGDHRMARALLNGLSPELRLQPGAMLARLRLDPPDSAQHASLRAAFASQMQRLPPATSSQWRVSLADALRYQGDLEALREWLPDSSESRLDARLLRLRSHTLGLIDDEPAGGYPALIADAQARGAWRLLHQASNEHSLQLSRRGEPQAARDALDRVLPLALQQGDPRSLSELQLALGALLALTGDADGSQDALQSALANAERTADPARIASVLTSLGMRLALQSRYDEAEAKILLARKLFADSGNRRGELVNLTNLGGIESRRGRLARARELYRESVAIAEQVGDRAELGRAQYNQAIVEQRLGDHANALQRMLQAVDQFMHAQAYVWASRATVQSAELLMAAGDIGRARAELKRMQAYRQGLASQDDARLALAWARWFDIVGDGAACTSQLSLAERGFSSAGQVDWLHLVTLRKARLEGRQARHREQALARVRVVRRELQRSSQPDRRDLVRAALTEVELLLASDQRDAAREAMRELNPALIDLHAPELTLQADMLDAWLADDAVHLQVLAEQAAQDGYALLAQWAWRRSGQATTLPVAVDPTNLEAQPSSAF